MPVQVIDTLQQKNGGKFPIVKAEDVGLDGGETLADKLKELEEIAGGDGSGGETDADFVADFEDALASQPTA